MDYAIIETDSPDNANVVNSIFFNNSIADYIDTIDGLFGPDPRNLSGGAVVNNNVTSGTQQGNSDGAPAFVMDSVFGISGTWISVEPFGTETIFTAEGDPFAGLNLTNRFVNPATDIQSGQSIILNHTDNRLFVHGDSRAAEAGSPFKIIDYGLTHISSAVDTAALSGYSFTSVPGFLMIRPVFCIPMKAIKIPIPTVILFFMPGLIESMISSRIPTRLRRRKSTPEMKTTPSPTAHGFSCPCIEMAPSSVKTNRKLAPMPGAWAIGYR
jgi:hypothetical protein